MIETIQSYVLIPLMSGCVAWLILTVRALKKDVKLLEQGTEEKEKEHGNYK